MGERPQTRATGGIEQRRRGGSIGRMLAFLSLPALIVAVAIYEPSYEPPLFDAQVHYNANSWQRIPEEAILNTADELNVPWMLVASTPNEGTWRLHARDRERVIPMLVPGFERDDRERWFNDPNILRYVERELRERPYRGIGEFFLFDGQVDTPVVARIVTLALERDLVLHARADPVALRRLFELGPALRIIWAHAGMFTPVATIAATLDRHRDLWIEISHRGDVAPRGRLDPQWRALMLRHPDRVLLGSGTYAPEYWHQFRTHLSRYRGWLDELPPEVAERIAYRNGVELFGLDLPARAAE